MLDIFRPFHGFHLGVDDAVPVLKKRGQITATDIAVLVDRGGQNRTAVFLVPGRVIGSPAEKRDPERRSTDDHSSSGCSDGTGALVREAINGFQALA